MTVYCAWVDNYDYDTYNGIVVVAQNKKKALKLIKDKGYFKPFQGEIHIDKVDLSCEHVILSSYNAG